MDTKIFNQEKIHLNDTQSKLRDAKSVLEKSMENMGGKNLDVLKDLRANPETNGADLFFFIEQLHEQNLAFNFKDKYKRLDEIDSLLKETYFARIDLQDSGSMESEAFYVGKFGYTEERPIITDWRAKVASVYYRYRYPQKNVKYETPDGIVTRDLSLKRTYEVDNGELIKYYNNDIQLDEKDIISGKIEKRTGGVLEDIVETIQESQLDIIESDPRQICVVQGCVGSGKSTVAIHKLSHIFFNFPKVITPERSILIAKNQILVGYLSTLFPKLGIFDINYKTLRDLVVNIIFRENLKLTTDFDTHTDTSAFTLDTYNDIQSRILEIHKQYEADIREVLLRPEFESFAGFKYTSAIPVYANLTDLIADLEEELDMQLMYLKEYTDSPKEWLWRENIKNLKKLVNTFKKYRTTLKETTLLELSKKLGVNTHQKIGYTEALIYLHIYAELIGFLVVPKYEYCVIDEGQDFSMLEYLIMGKLVINGRFCILGDLNQSYQADGLSSWDVISHVIKDAKKAKTFTLDTNYRSTKPIIDLANNILGKFTQDYLPKSINRKGIDPVIHKLNTINDIASQFEKNITSDINEMNKSVGVICFNDDYYNLAESILNKFKLDDGKLIKLDSTKKIAYIPQGIYLTKFEDCKGLEFSKVHVLGLSLDQVSNYLEAKKAFVSVTRAMNEVEVYSL